MGVTYQKTRIFFFNVNKLMSKNRKYRTSGKKIIYWNIGKKKKKYRISENLKVSEHIGKYRNVGEKYWKYRNIGRKKETFSLTRFLSRTIIVEFHLNDIFFELSSLHMQTSLRGVLT